MSKCRERSIRPRRHHRAARDARPWHCAQRRGHGGDRRIRCALRARAPTPNARAGGRYRSARQLRRGPARRLHDRVCSRLTECQSIRIVPRQSAREPCSGAAADAPSHPLEADARATFAVQSIADSKAVLYLQVQDGCDGTATLCGDLRIHDAMVQYRLAPQPRLYQRPSTATVEKTRSSNVISCSRSAGSSPLAISASCISIRDAIRFMKARPLGVT